jgi:transposase-like protein
MLPAMPLSLDITCFEQKSLQKKQTFSEELYRQLRKVTKTKTTYPTDDSLRKIIYLATVDATKKWTMPVKDWGQCIPHLSSNLAID